MQDAPDEPDQRTNDDPAPADAAPEEVVITDDQAVDSEALEPHLGYVFNDHNLLVRALTHPSFAHESPGVGGSDNQRLEFLGDAVLGLSVARQLFARFPSLPEGRLSRMKAALVCEDTLADLGRRLGLGQYLRLGRGERASGGTDKASIVSDAVEAVLAAIYIDGGYSAAADVIERLFGDLFEDAHAGRLVDDYKTALQEHAQGVASSRPIYKVVERSGPPHLRLFKVAVSVAGEVLAQGEGRSKKEAEKVAAGRALRRLLSDPDESVEGEES